jgi:hypothetical protein
MADVNFQWEIRSGEGTESNPHFDPGAPVEGRLTISPSADLNCSGITLRLEWHTEGRGDREGNVSGETILFQGVLPGGQPSVFPFHMKAPDQPWSYSGHHIHIVWELAADIDMPLAINPKSRHPVVIRPRG